MSDAINSESAKIFFDQEGYHHFKEQFFSAMMNFERDVFNIVASLHNDIVSRKSDFFPGLSSFEDSYNQIIADKVETLLPMITKFERSDIVRRLSEGQTPIATHFLKTASIPKGSNRIENLFSSIEFNDADFSIEWNVYPGMNYIEQAYDLELAKTFEHLSQASVFPNSPGFGGKLVRKENGRPDKVTYFAHPAIKDRIDSALEVLHLLTDFGDRRHILSVIDSAAA